MAANYLGNAQMSNLRPILTYRMTLPKMWSNKLIVGRLFLQESNRKQMEYMCTSGLPQYQSWQSWHQAGLGPIPPCLDLNLEYYQVQVIPIDMRTMIGVSGLFYKILPHIMRTDKYRRSDFGIHWDANIPGTAGCIGFRDVKEWGNFQMRMMRIQEEGHKTVPLVVEYLQPSL